jgi:NAD(P)-dependent dehydrogenase (short-subunit alcohol dehydrogenase family)
MNPQRRRLLRLAGAAAAAPLLCACGPGRDLAEDVPRSPFDADATAEEVTADLDLSGKTAVVTGCTSGLGFETMRVLALRGAYVLGTGRTLESAAAACRRVAGLTTPLQLELSDPLSIIDCAEKIRSLQSPVDMLICNAGYRGGDGERELVDGVEKHFVVNHLGHFLLVNRVLDRLFFAWQGRIVVVASRASYRDAPEDGILFDDLAMNRQYSDALGYGHSKLANVLFAHGLARRLRGTRITANSLHPGVVDTRIDRHLSRPVQWLFGTYAAVVGKTVPQGAATTCFVATSPLLGSSSGRYFEDCNAVTVDGSHLADTTMSDRLWEVSESLLKDHIVRHERPDWSQFENGVRRRKAGDAG